MDRKEAIKKISFFGLLPFLSFQTLLSVKNYQKENKPLNIIGLGGAGANMVSYIKDNAYNANYLAIVTPDNVSDIEKFVINKPKLTSEIKSIFNKNNSYVLFTGLGGKTGTSLVEKLSKYLTEKQIDFTVICTIPFKFEGKRRLDHALTSLDRLQNYKSVKHINLEIFGKDKNMTVSKAFKLADKKAFELLKTVV